MAAGGFEGAGSLLVDPVRRGQVAITVIVATYSDLGQVLCGPEVGIGMKAIRRTVLNAISLGTVLAVLATAVHEWAFYWWLAPDLVDLPQTSDYLITALRWLPGTMMVVFGGFAGVILIPQSDGRFVFLPRKRKKTSRWWRLLGALINFLLPGVGVVFLGLMVIWVILTPNPPVMFKWLLFTVLWFWVSRWIARQWNVWGSGNPYPFILLYFGPVCIALVVADGISDAQYIQEAEHGNYTIELEDSGSIKGVLLVRNLAAGVLVAVPSEGHLRFFPWSDVESMRADIPATRSESVTCEWLRTSSAEGDGWFLTDRLRRMCEGFLPRDAQGVSGAESTVPTSTDVRAD